MGLLGLPTSEEESECELSDSGSMVVTEVGLTGKIRWSRMEPERVYYKSITQHVQTTTN